MVDFSAPQIATVRIQSLYENTNTSSTILLKYLNTKISLVILSLECHLHALMCSVSVVTVVFIHTMEDDQRLNTLVHEGDPVLDDIAYLLTDAFQADCADFSVSRYRHERGTV